MSRRSWNCGRAARLAQSVGRKVQSNSWSSQLAPSCPDTGAGIVADALARTPVSGSIGIGSSYSGLRFVATPCRSWAWVIPKRARNPTSRRQSARSASRAPGELARVARAFLTRPRRSRSLRSAARSSASRESSGRPLVVSQTRPPGGWFKGVVERDSSRLPAILPEGDLNRRRPRDCADIAR
jgi:hypothetical protein